jgi:hypothetical protein
MCPVCTVAVGFGLGLSRWLKIDDAISGLWIGALIVSLSAVTATFSRKYIRQISHSIQTIIWLIIYLATVIIPFWLTGVMGHPQNVIFGVDKLLFGIVAGMIGFFLSHEAHVWLKKKHDNKVYFPFQKVIIPIWGLLVLSIIVYLIVS